MFPLDYSSNLADFPKEFLSDNFDRPIELELGPMDFAGFQMLQNNDPLTTIADPTIEDSFRRDLH